MSSDNTAASSSGDQPRKRVRRSGWDIPGPVDQTQAPATVIAQPAPVQPSTSSLTMQQQALLRAQQAVLSLGLSGIPIAQPRAGHRIYVGSIHYDLRESDMVTLFSSFGTITKSEMTIDPMTNRTKGFCFLEFAEQSQAEAAMAMDGFELAGRRIKVGKPFHGQGAVANPITAGLNLPALGIVPASSGMQPSAVSANLIAQQAILNLSASLAATDALTCVLVKNVTPLVKVEELKPIFEAFGHVKRVLFVDQGRIPDLALGTRAVIVEYDNAATAKTTTDGLNNFPLGGADLSLSVLALSRANQLLAVDTSSYKRVVLEDMVTYEDTLDAGLKDEISEEACTYGTLLDVEIKVADVAGRKEVTVVLVYGDPLDAAKALKAMNGRAFGGKKIKAVLAP